ncbi:MAG: CobW family GTP-binding protein [Hyphomicrobiaceae bacterium]
MAPVAKSSLPVTVIGGYLGSGKTTLVNHLLRSANGLRIAVLVNEFGELPIDADLIEAQDENIISIAGGCVCCSYGNDLMLAMIDLAQITPPPEHVLVEASGVAIPSAIASSIGLLTRYSLDGVVVLADGETLRALAHDRYMGGTVRSQLKDADLLILNKVDLVRPSKLSATRLWLSNESAHAKIIGARHANVPPEVVLGLARSDQSLQQSASLHHGDLFTSISFSFDRPIDVALIAKRLAGDELGVVRAKGFATALDGTPHEIQIVGRRWTATAIPTAPYSGIVCIGSKDQLQTGPLSTLVEQSCPLSPSP